jgi:hypothetical protein
MKQLHIIAVAAVPILFLGSSLLKGDAPTRDERMPAAKTRHLGEGIKTLPQFEGFEWITAETGDFSPTTGEYIKGKAAYLSAFIEGADGGRHAGFGQNPQQMLIFTTASGRFVLRFLNWQSPY